MKKPRKPALDPDRDTMRPEYDFSSGVRGVTARRFAEGSNVVVLEPDVAERFPTAEAVNDALRSLAAVADRVPTRKKARSRTRNG
jgi:hypothetical protein